MPSGKNPDGIVAVRILPPDEYFPYSEITYLRDSDSYAPSGEKILLCMANGRFVNCPNLSKERTASGEDEIFTPTEILAPLGFTELNPSVHSLRETRLWLYRSGARLTFQDAPDILLETRIRDGRIRLPLKTIASALGFFLCEYAFTENIGVVSVETDKKERQYSDEDAYKLIRGELSATLSDAVALGSGLSETSVRALREKRAKLEVILVGEFGRYFVLRTSCCEKEIIFDSVSGAVWNCYDERGRFTIESGIPDPSESFRVSESERHPQSDRLTGSEQPD